MEVLYSSEMTDGRLAAGAVMDFATGKNPLLACTEELEAGAVWEPVTPDDESLLTGVAADELAEGSATGLVYPALSVSDVFDGMAGEFRASEGESNGSFRTTAA
jgi:hypothetical protein